MTIKDLLVFLESSLPNSCKVIEGKNDMLKIVSPSTFSEAYLRYRGELDFELEGVSHSQRSPVKQYSFKNEFIMAAILSSLVLQLLDGDRRV